MLYDAYQAQNDIFGPVRLMAGTAQRLAPPSMAADRRHAFVRSAAAAMELLSHAGMSHERPDFRIEPVTIDGKEIAVHEEVVGVAPVLQPAAFPQGHDARGADRLGRRAAVRPFPDPVARHGRNLAGRSQRLPDRLGQCARRSAAVTAGSISTISSSW